jgi:hypothetical protein
VFDTSALVREGHLKSSTGSTGSAGRQPPFVSSSRSWSLADGPEAGRTGTNRRPDGGQVTRSQ